VVSRSRDQEVRGNLVGPMVVLAGMVCCCILKLDAVLVSFANSLSGLFSIP
jgi:hypothetical protein